MDEPIKELVAEMLRRTRALRLPRSEPDLTDTYEIMRVNGVDVIFGSRDSIDITLDRSSAYWYDGDHPAIIGPTETIKKVVQRLRLEMILDDIAEV